MYNIIQLNDKELSELQQIAKELGLKKVDSLRKEELVYRILDEQAIVGATKAAAKAEERKEGQARKRSRISVKKEGDKVYTATKDKAQKLEANTPAVAAPAPTKSRMRQLLQPSLRKKFPLQKNKQKSPRRKKLNSRKSADVNLVLKIKQPWNGKQ